MNDLLPIFPALPRPLIVAGPCAAENRAQTLADAEALAATGIRIFRAGVWKPRTKPGAFEGAGAPALRWLAEAGRRTGMAPATEVATPAHLRLAMGAGIDTLWLGARTVANPFAVQDIADAIRDLPAQSREALTILVKNPLNPDLELWIGALERIYRAGVRRLAAVHRGFSLYGEKTYRNTPLWRIPLELHRRLPALTILCDPSHIAGRRDLVPQIARQALELGFDGLMIESRLNPDAALSDAAQQITPDALAALLPSLTTEFTNQAPLDDLRAQIDAIDSEILDALARRMAITAQIGSIKKEKGMSVFQPDRYNQMLGRLSAMARERGLNPEFVRAILETIHEESVRDQLSAEKE